jgi:hypothetical protein
VAYNYGVGAGATGSERRRMRTSADRDAAQQRHAETIAGRAAAMEVRRKRARSLTPDRESDGEEGGDDVGMFSRLTRGAKPLKDDRV